MIDDKPMGEGFSGLQPVLQQVVLAALREARARVEREGFESVWKANVDAAAVARAPIARITPEVTAGLEAAAAVGKRLVADKLRAARAVMDAYDMALQELESAVPTKRRSAVSTTDFRRWRREVDSEERLDTFDLALGWFAGHGASHERACQLADKVAGGAARPRTES